MKYIITENKLDKVALTWLNNNFGDLTPSVKDGIVSYLDKNRKPFFFYYEDEDKKNRYVHVNYNKIWYLKSMFGMDYYQIQNILEYWLGETYNVRGLTPIFNSW